MIVYGRGSSVPFEYDVTDEERGKYFYILSVGEMLELARRTLEDSYLQQALIAVQSIDVPDEVNARAHLLEQEYLRDQGKLHLRVLGLGTPTALASKVLTLGWKLDGPEVAQFLEAAHARSVKSADVTIAQWHRSGD